MALAALVVLCVNLEVSLRMEADGTDVGGFGADDDVAAVAGHRLTGKSGLEVLLSAGAGVFVRGGRIGFSDSDLNKVGGGELARTLNEFGREVTLVQGY